MKTPLELFFKLGEKATKGDPKRQQDFTYYMVWILFLAFATMFVTNLIGLIKEPAAMSAVWAMVGFAIMGLQYFTLKGLYEMKKLRKNPSQGNSEEEEKGVEEMLASFKKLEGEKTFERMQEDERLGKSGLSTKMYDEAVKKNEGNNGS